MKFLNVKHCPFPILIIGSYMRLRILFSNVYKQLKWDRPTLTPKDVGRRAPHVRGGRRKKIKRD